MRSFYHYHAIKILKVKIEQRGLATLVLMLLCCRLPLMHAGSEHVEAQR